MGVLLKMAGFSPPQIKRWGEFFIILGVLGVFAFAKRLPEIPTCPIRYFSDSRCPTCGTTRSVWHLLHGRFAEAWRMNPVGFVVFLVLMRRLWFLLYAKVGGITPVAHGPAADWILLFAFFACGLASLY